MEFYIEILYRSPKLSEALETQRRKLGIISKIKVEKCSEAGQREALVISPLIHTVSVPYLC